VIDQRLLTVVFRQMIAAGRDGHIAWAVDVSNMKLTSNPERSNVR
jgi:hypothetical protein